jgi:predicted nuclease with TOPRIM domain
MARVDRGLLDFLEDRQLDAQEIRECIEKSNADASMVLAFLVALCDEVGRLEKRVSELGG